MLRFDSIFTYCTKPTLPYPMYADEWVLLVFAALLTSPDSGLNLCLFFGMIRKKQKKLVRKCTEKMNISAFSIPVWAASVS